MANSPELTRIGVFYDGQYFQIVNNYYHYVHQRKCQLSISGIHNFIRAKIAELENTSIQLCQVVDAHYFRGRLSAQEAQNRQVLLGDRSFDDILMREGVITHYSPVKKNMTREGPKYTEKGIDVWFALEAFELAIYKRFNVLVLIASDGDYLPLVRKVSTLGTRVMLMAWDFKYTDEDGVERETRTAQELLEVATYPIAMHEVIDARAKKDDPIINSLFVPEKRFVANIADHQKSIESRIASLREGWGWLENKPDNVFFHWRDLINAYFEDLKIGDRVRFQIAIDNVTNKRRAIQVEKL